jgi:hypothetical protein
MAKRNNVKELVERLESQGYQAKFNFYLMPTDAGDRQDIKTLRGRMGSDGYEAVYMFTVEMLADGIKDFIDGALYIGGTNVPHDHESYGAARGHDPEFVKKAWAHMERLGLIIIEDGVVRIADVDYWYGEAVGLVAKRANGTERYNRCMDNKPKKGQIPQVITAPVKSTPKSDAAKAAKSSPLGKYANADGVIELPTAPNAKKQPERHVVAATSFKVCVDDLPYQQRAEIAKIVCDHGKNAEWEHTDNRDYEPSPWDEISRARYKRTMPPMRRAICCCSHRPATSSGVTRTRKVTF